MNKEPSFALQATEDKARNMEQGIRIRTVILLCLLLSGVSYTQAQSAGNIDTLSQWRIDHHYVDSYGPWTDHYKYYISGTVIIDSLEYFKVYKSGYEYGFYGGTTYYTHIYRGPLREQGNKWYTYFDGRDTVLFDFNLDVGDTVISAANFYFEIITVDSINIIQVDGEDKKQIHFTGEDTGESSYIIEDVGAATGLWEPLINWFEIHSFMHCYAIDFVPLWINPEFGWCDLTVSIEEPEEVRDVVIYPNPFTTSTTIEYELTESSHVQLTIYNAIGETIHVALDRMMPVGKHSFTWTADRLPEGLYYAVLRSEEGVSVVKMMKQ